MEDVRQKVESIDGVTSATINLVFEPEWDKDLSLIHICRLFGHCRQAYYQSKADIESQIHRERLMLDAVRDIRIEDPGIGLSLIHIY